MYIYLPHHSITFPSIAFFRLYSIHHNIYLFRLSTAFSNALRRSILFVTVSMALWTSGCSSSVCLNSNRLALILCGLIRFQGVLHMMCNVLLRNNEDSITYRLQKSCGCGFQKHQIVSGTRYCLSAIQIRPVLSLYSLSSDSSLEWVILLPILFCLANAQI